MADTIYSFDSENSLLNVSKAAKMVLGRKTETQRPRGPKDEGGGGCDTQNTIWDVSILGKPTGGTYDLYVTVNATSTWITFDYNETDSSFATQLATHAEITSSDIDVTGGGHPNVAIRIEFIGDLENTYILHPIADTTNLTGGSGVGVIVQMAQKGHG